MTLDPQEIIRWFDEMGVIDTHEHIGVEDGVCHDARFTERRKRTLWDIVFGAYLPAMFQCAGETNPPQLRYNDDEEAIWAWLKPRLPVIHNTGTYRALMRGLHECYSLPEMEITEENWRPLSQKIQHHYQNTSRYDWYAAGAAKAGVSKILRLVDPIYYARYRPRLAKPDARTERRLFAPISYVDFFLFPDEAEADRKPDVAALLQLLGTRAIGSYLDYLAEDGSTVAVKFACAYMRSLEFKPADPQTRVVNTICRLAGERGLPVIFHTGLGNADVRAGHPAHLLPLIDACPETKFVLLHAGFPYWQELAAIAARRANVLFDLSWSPLLSRGTFRSIFSQAIELVQANKFLLGHDVSTIEHLVGTHRITIETIAEVLCEKVRLGYFTAAGARTLVCQLARENANRVFKLPTA